MACPDPDQLTHGAQGETWSKPRDISSFLPPELTDPREGLRPSYGSGTVVPSAANPKGRILMTGYDHKIPSCHVYTSEDGGESWQMASSIPHAFECGSVATLYLPSSLHATFHALSVLSHTLALNNMTIADLFARAGYFWTARRGSVIITSTLTPALGPHLLHPTRSACKL